MDCSKPDLTGSTGQKNVLHQHFGRWSLCPLLLYVLDLEVTLSSGRPEDV